MQSDFNQEAADPAHSSLMTRLSWIVAFAFGVLFSIFISYFIRFSENGFSGDPAEWGQFGDFVGGFANPILGFLTLISLSLTIALQSRQLSISSRELELSRKELTLTRDELSRTARAQEESEKALRAQAKAADRSARLAATNYLLEHYKAELSDMRGIALTSNDPRVSRMNSLREREQVLLRTLDSLFEDVTKGD